MRTLGAALQAHLAGDATTLCHAWRVSRTDGIVLGFTDHDHDLAFSDTLFVAASGFDASDGDSESGLAAPSREVLGALSGEAISEADIIAGRYDGAKVELFSVNWAAPAQHIRLQVLEIGEISRTQTEFHAELRSFTHRLGQTQGRIYGHGCDANFGDGRCGMDLASYTESASVAVVHGAGRIEAAGLDDFASGYFRYGLATFSTGANAGASMDIESHAREAGVTTLVFWLPLPIAPVPGDLFTISRGCDKRFATCRDGFANSVNFRGFPHMPGSDFSYSYADGDTDHDGSPLYD